MTETLLEEILATEPDEAKVLQAVNEYRSEHYKVDRENKQLICNLLCATLKATRDQHDLQSLTYHFNGPDDQMVTVAWSEGGTSVNVSMDSGIAMIRDILRAIQ